MVPTPLRPPLFALFALSLLSLLSHATALDQGGFPMRPRPQLLRPAAALAPCVRRTCGPLLLARKKKAGGNKKKGSAAESVPDVPLPLMVPDDTISAGPTYAEPIVAELQSGWREVVSDDGEVFFYNDATGVSQWERPNTAPLPRPGAFASGATTMAAAPLDAGMAAAGTSATAAAAATNEGQEELPRYDGGPLPYGDGTPALSLPSFDDYKRGPPKPLPADDGAFRSKLTPINPGKPLYDAVEKEEKPFLEKWVFRLTWGGIIVLVAIEIFINTPLFAQVRPIILQFIGDGGYE